MTEKNIWRFMDLAANEPDVTYQYLEYKTIYDSPEFKAWDLNSIDVEDLTKANIKVNNYVDKYGLKYEFLYKMNMMNLVDIFLRVKKYEQKKDMLLRIEDIRDKLEKYSLGNDDKTLLDALKELKHFLFRRVLIFTTREKIMAFSSLLNTEYLLKDRSSISLDSEVFLPKIRAGWVSATNLDPFNDCFNIWRYDVFMRGNNWKLYVVDDVKEFLEILKQLIKED